jgi:ureidoglycolate hydrolase
VARVHPLEVELLTEQAFKPFGDVLQVTDKPLDFEGSGIHGWATPFESDAGALFLVLRTPYQGLRIGTLERHHHVTQAAYPIGGSPAVMAVAPPTDPSDPDALPAPDDVRAFLLDGSAGYVFRKGTWHTNRYPLFPPWADYFMVTDAATQDELTTVPQAHWQRTQQVDYGERLGVVFEALVGREAGASGERLSRRLRGRGPS